MRSVLCMVLDWFWPRFYVFYQRAHVVKANGKSFYIVFSFTLEWRLWLSKISGTYLSSWTLLTMMFAVLLFCCLLDCEQHVPSVGLRQRWLCQHPWLCAYLRLRASRCFSGLFCCRAPKRIIWCTSSTAATWTTMVFLFYRCHQGVLSSEEVEKCVYCVLKTDPSVEPEMLDELTIQHTRNVGMKGRWNVGVRAAAHRHDSRNQSRRFGRMGAAR